MERIKIATIELSLDQNSINVDENSFQVISNIKGNPALRLELLKDVFLDLIREIDEAMANDPEAKIHDLKT